MVLMMSSTFVQSLLFVLVILFNDNRVLRLRPEIVTVFRQMDLDDCDVHMVSTDNVA